MIAEIIARLQSQVPALKLVGGAAAFNAASQANPAATPAAFVFVVDESDDENGLEQPMVQESTVTLAVVLVVRQVSDAQGAAAEPTWIPCGKPSAPPCAAGSSVLITIHWPGGKAPWWLSAMATCGGKKPG